MEVNEYVVTSLAFFILTCLRSAGVVIAIKVENMLMSYMNAALESWMVLVCAVKVEF